jgi:acetyl/propionyl-CoA carboxylase alpha subunit
VSSTLLVANRGEIAVRIVRTAKAMGMRTVAVYSDADASALHVSAADEAIRIGEAPAADSYLRRDRIIEAARSVGADLIHPGYGFLAEDDRFADDCASAGLRFVGPPASVLRAVGDKASARELALRGAVPVLPGYQGADQTDDALRAAAQAIGFPVLVKPSAGGGGKGMAVVREPNEMSDALASARRVAKAAFDDDRLILERYIDGPRHVEVQVIADAHGTVLHLGERDCSLQRRHQKILEETPAPNLDDDTRRRLHEAGVAFAHAAGYVNAGTCEFLVSAEGDIGFIEMNARLQVEHPVTEVVTGLDLVELQLRIALGERLPIAQADVASRGHAIEVRVYAEDPREGFLPQAGRIEHVRWPDAARVDAGVEQGSEVSTYYDPMLAKVIVAGDDRAHALDALTEALDATEILGPRTNIAFLRSVIDDPVVREGRVTTSWLDAADIASFVPSEPTPEGAIRIAAASELARSRATTSNDPFSSIGPWRVSGDGAATIVLRPDGVERAVAVTDPDVLGVAARVDGAWLVWFEGDQYEIPVGPAQRRLIAAAAHLTSPLPGQVIAVNVAAGDAVEAGAELVVVEAMKMEHAIRAPAAGVVTAVLCAAGDQVARGQTLIDLDAGEG